MLDILDIITTCATRKVWSLSALNYSARFLFDSRQFEAQVGLAYWNVRREGRKEKLKCGNFQTQMKFPDLRRRDGLNGMNDLDVGHL